MFDRVVVAALDLSDRTFIVVENVVPTLLGAVGLLDVLKRIGFPEERQSIIVNRQQRITGGLSLADVAQRFGRQIDFVLPFEKRVMVAANSGEPIAQSGGRLSGFCRVLFQVVDSIEDEANRTPLMQAASTVGESVPDLPEDELDAEQDIGEDEAW